MSKRLVLILLLLAVGITACSVALSRRDSRDWRANRSRRLFPFPWQDTAAITIAKPNGDTLRFEKDARGEWQVHLPYDLSDTLDYQAVDVVAALATLAWREPMRDPPASFPEKPVTLTATTATGQRVELAFGDVRNNLRAAIVDNDPDIVYGVNQDLLAFLDWPESRFRNLYLATAGGGRTPDRLVLAPAGGNDDLRIVLERGDDGWRQTRPVAWPVDESRLDLLLRWVERLRAESIEAEMSGDLEWFGFDAESAFVEAHYDDADSRLVRRVEFGKAAENDATYARVDGRNPVFAVPDELLAEISLTVAAEHPRLWKDFYRRRSFNMIGDVMPQALEVERLLPTPAKITLYQVRDRDGAHWRGTLEEAGASREFAVEPPDANDPMRPLTALVTGLSTLRVKVFLSDAAPGPDTGKLTAHPAWRFTCRLPDGGALPAITLYAADAEGNLPPGRPFAEGLAGAQEMTPLPDMPARVGIAFSRENTPAVMEMYGELAYLLCLPPYRYQSRKILDCNPRLWRRVDIVREGETTSYFRREGDVNEQWWLASDSPEPLMDDNNRFVAMLSALAQLRAEAVVADEGADLSKFGLDQPTITAIVYTSEDKAAPVSRDGLLFKLTMGGDTPEGGVYARLDDSGPVFLVSRNWAEGLHDIYR